MDKAISNFHARVSELRKGKNVHAAESLSEFLKRSNMEGNSYSSLKFVLLRQPNVVCIKGNVNTPGYKKFKEHWLARPRAEGVSSLL